MVPELRLLFDGNVLESIYCWEDTTIDKDTATVMVLLFDLLGKGGQIHSIEFQPKNNEASSQIIKDTTNLREKDTNEIIDEPVDGEATTANPDTEQDDKRRAWLDFTREMIVEGLRGVDLKMRVLGKFPDCALGDHVFYQMPKKMEKQGEIEPAKKMSQSSPNTRLLGKRHPSITDF